MPFTPVHTVLTLPFARTKAVWISATSLIIGSMAPDVEYFIIMNPNDHHGHTWLGSLYFDIPVTIALAFLFHVVVKKNLINNLPLSMQRRLQPVLHFDFVTYFKKHYIAFIVCAWLGTWSHFFLDSFTHDGGFFVRHLHYTDVTVLFGSVHYPLYYFLQMLISAVGVVVIFMYFLWMPSEDYADVNVHQSVTYWLSLLLVSAAIVVIHYVISHSVAGIANLVISCIAGFLGAFVICGLIDFKTLRLAKIR